MDGVARDEEADNKVAALITFLEKIHLSQYHDRLVNDLGVADMKELPDLVANVITRREKALTTQHLHCRPYAASIYLGSDGLQKFLLVCSVVLHRWGMQLLHAHRLKIAPHAHCLVVPIA